MESGKGTSPKLNEAQLEAVAIDQESALVVAGAGTGKTRVTVERINRLLASGVPPGAILALTFTEKAAAEMLTRAATSQIQASLDLTIATFNGFGNELLETYGAEMGLGQLHLLGDTGQLVFLRERLDELGLEYFAPVSNPSGQLEVLTEYVSHLKQQLVQPTHYIDYAKTLPAKDAAAKLEKTKHQELARFFDTYIKLCRREQVIDYDDQIYLTIELLEERPNILRQLQQKYRYILVDEFQDTNPMQSKLVDLMAGREQTGAGSLTIRLSAAETVSVRSREPQASRIGDTVKRGSQGFKPEMSSKSAESHALPESRQTGASSLMVVGDDDQSIYGWRGATLANILDFKKNYPAAREITLIENYRSSQAILDSAYRLIQHNNPNRLEIINQLNKRLRGQSQGSAPALKHFANLDAELAWLANDIERRLSAGQKPGSIAVLARRGQGVQKVHEALELYSVPHVAAGLGNDIYQNNAVRQLIEVLKSVGDPSDDLALFHTLIGPVFELSVSELAKYSAQARRSRQSLAEVLGQSGGQAFGQALTQIETWRRTATENVGSLAYRIITDSGWKQRLYSSAQSSPSSFNDMQALSKFFKTLKEFERVAGVASVQNYILNLPMLQAAGRAYDDATLDIAEDMVNVLSIHRAKGLEWETVFILDCTEGSFPLRTRSHSLEMPAALAASQNQADDHLAEERRLMYVALTRARREVILSYSDRHGSGSLRRPSRFIAEIFEDLPNEQAAETPSETNLELFSPKTPRAQAVSLPETIYKKGEFTLSVSQIECWLRCPEDFYYKYVLNMPLPPAPQLGYGTLIHRVIEMILKGRKSGEAPTLEELTRLVLDDLPKCGYASKGSKDRLRAQAEKTVKVLFDRLAKEDLPEELELDFSLRLEDIPLTIHGRIDAVYPRAGGVEIRDFKTGTSVRTAEQAKSRASGSDQLTLYALAWKTLRGEMPALLSLDFVETGVMGSVKRQAKSLTTLKAKLKTMVEQLEAGQFPPGRDHRRCLHPVQP